MKTKICTKCGSLKAETEFNWKIKDKKRRNRCKECSRAYSRDHYYRNKEYYRKKNRRLRQRAKKFIEETKLHLKCAKCSENHIACLEFHHNDPSKKEFNVSALRDTWSLERIKEEMEKCTVLCSNCHKKLHYEEKRMARGVVATQRSLEPLSLVRIEAGQPTKIEEYV